MALANPDKFVLKPQREGGGNNFFGEDIVRVLTELKNDKRRASYILMDRIQPRLQQNILLRRGLLLSLNTVCCEIGVFGACVRHDGEMVLNEALGPILRTKRIEQNDGGVKNLQQYRENSTVKTTDMATVGRKNSLLTGRNLQQNQAQ